MSLTTWFKEDWVDIGSKKKGGGLKSVADQNKKQTLKESIQSVSRLQKQLA